MLVVSEHLLVELVESFADPSFGCRLSAEVIEAALDSLRIDGVVQLITVTVIGIAAHAEDDGVFVTAPSANAPYLVTGDKPPLARRADRGTRMLSPRQFLDVWERQGPTSTL